VEHLQAWVKVFLQSTISDHGYWKLDLYYKHFNYSR
jgi:hypothetical protein